jgi:hypothetical protein
MPSAWRSAASVQQVYDNPEASALMQLCSAYLTIYHNLRPPSSGQFPTYCPAGAPRHNYEQPVRLTSQRE